MVDFECLHCGNEITRDFETFVGVVRCSNCSKTMWVFVKDRQLIATDYNWHDVAQVNEILSRREVR